MKRIVIMLVLINCSCDKSVEQAEAHLRSLGHKAVACAKDGRGATTCSTDEGERFRCAVTDPEGRSNDSPVACERFYVEKPAP